MTKMSSFLTSQLIEQLVSTIMTDPEQKKLLVEYIEKHNKSQCTNWPVEIKPKTHDVGVLDLISYSGAVCNRYDNGNPFSEDIFLIKLPNQCCDIDDDHSREDYLIQDLKNLPWCDDGVVSGSSVVKILAKHLRGVDLEVAKKFSETATDIDIFKLNQPKVDITKIFVNDSQKIDVVSTTLGSVQELLMGFDLPCCRAALKSSPDVLELYVSRQCISSLINGKMTLPSYMKDLNPKQFTSRLMEGVFSRFNARLKKYQGRGILTDYEETQDDWPWFSKGFMYSDSGILKLNIKKTDKGFKIQQ